MWVKIALSIILFYILAVLQKSFFIHFAILGGVPNLVFVLFFSLVFFKKEDYFFDVLFYSLVAGLFLDFFSFTYIGTSVFFLIMIGFLLKKVQSMLTEKHGDDFPLVYFLPLFLGAVIIYQFLLNFYFYFPDISRTINSVDLAFFANVIYSLIIGCVVYFIFKKFLAFRLNNRQMSLFQK